MDYMKDLEKGMSKPSLASKGANQEILDHQRKRQVELKLMEFRLAMEDRGFDEDEIETRVAEVRKKLENEEMTVKAAEPKLSESHALAEQVSRKACPSFGTT